MRSKKILCTVLFLLSCLGLSAQVYNNEWINYSQKYYKLKIAKDGLYQLDSASLANSGIPVSIIDPRNIQLFHKGKEIYPYIFGESDGVLNTNDYILFYAEKNSGRDDSLLYDHVPFLTNPYYSVINDTAAVFFTWNGLTTNHRLALDTDTTFSQYPAAAPYYYKEIYSTSGFYGPGPLTIFNQDDPRYQLGEGFAFAQLSENASTSLSFNSSAVYTSFPLAYFTVCVSGSNNILAPFRDHIIQISYTSSTGTQVLLPHDSLSAYVSERYNFPINPSSFGPNTNITVTSLPNPGAGGIDNTTNINYITAWVPQQFNMLNATQEKIYLPDDINQTKSKLVLSNFNSQGSSPILIDTTNHKISFLTQSGSNYLALVPNTGSRKFCYLSSKANVDSTEKLTAINGTGSFVNYQPLVTDSNYLIISHPNLMSAATAYQTYRSSFVGGNFPVILASITDLYDQFAHGVELSPLAIRNFCASVIANPAKNPSHLFLVGKSIHAKDCMIGGNSGGPDFYAVRNLVPSFGNPPSDNLLTQGLPGSLSLDPAIPTGRLAAQSLQDVNDYLSKVILHEQQTDDSLWKKRAIHFIGGANAGEQNSLKYYMDVMKSIYQDTLLGGKVFSFYKISTDPMPITTNDSVRQLINSGVSLLTFFGHGSQTGFDQNIDDPQNYTNSPKFPLVVANSCYTGDIHSADQLSHSEVFTLAHNNHGSIGYIATVSEGIANDLFYYSQEFYRQFSYKSYGQTYGSCVKKAVQKLIVDFNANVFSNDSNLIFTVLEMTLHGDPAIKPNYASKPDYAITNPDVILQTASPVPFDSIRVKLIVTNLGKAIKDSITVIMQRDFPNGDSVTFIKNIKGPYYKDTLSFSIPKDYYRAVGINNFYVSVNGAHIIQEITFSNNNTSAVSLFIPGSDIEPVWPYKYAIVPNTDSVTLKASTADPFAAVATYKFQVDTSDAFTNPFINTTVTGPGGVITLPVKFTQFNNKDSMVYFWRVAKDTIWKESSFQVITGKYGWGQAHFHQFKNDGYQYVKYKRNPNEFDFVNDYKSIKVNDVICSGSYLNFDQTVFFYNNLRERQWSCAPDGFTIAVIDSVTGILKLSDGLNGNAVPYQAANGNCLCVPNVPLTAFDFGGAGGCANSSNWRTNLYNFIVDSIPQGAYVLAYAVKLDDYADTITPQLISAFNSIGSSQISNLTDTTLLIVFGRKGAAPGTAHEVLSTNKNQLITLVDSIKTNFHQGSITSEIIGPCMFTDTAWQSLHWHYEHFPGDVNPSADTIYIDLIGIASNGQKYLRATFPIDSLDVLDLSNYVSGKQFPYIQLVAHEMDLVNNTPPQMKRWQVIFDQAPECAIDPPSGFSVVKTSVAEGENFEVRVPIKNISDFPFNDSLLVTYYLQDVNRVNHNLPYALKKKPFLPGALIIDTVKVSTLGYAGNDILWIDVNPPGVLKYQPEQFHFNNVAEVAFGVNKDKINPLLDVTFDGVHILNGDIVSAKPNIYVSLKDENKFLALNDTSKFTVSILYPGASTETRLYFKDVLQFIPAQLPNNSCKINYHPALSKDGIHMLHIKASDRTGNASGQFDYRIQFDVINKATITEVLNYPNPFSTSTKFVFTITGSEIPETFKIQILTITGRVVKEVTRDELGFLHIGRNITDYAWDGKDQFGDQLANGVYLYRVQTRLHGDEVEHLSNSADAYFKKGFGKMLLMR